jgi:hypothetical protein
MTITNSDSELIKMDCIGRVRTSAEHREALLTAYEESALSGPEFCKHHGIKYQTFATWLQKHRRATGAYPSTESLKKHAPLLSLSLTEVELPQLPQSPSGRRPESLEIRLPGGASFCLNALEQLSLATALLNELNAMQSC